MQQQRMIRDIIRESYSLLWKSPDQFSDIHMISHLRLNREHSILPFKDFMTDGDRIALLKEIRNFIDSSFDKCFFYPPSNFEKNDILLLEESEVLHSNEIPDGFLFPDNDEIVSINGNHHISITITSGSCNFDSLSEKAISLSDKINKFIPYAFSPDYGYLFSNPLDNGSGIQVSSLLHIPALSMLKCFPEVKKISDDLMINAVPYQEQGGNPLFCLLSTRIIQGTDEKDTIHRIHRAIELISEIERDAREEYYYEFEPQIDDAVWRSFGVLSHARMISYREAFEYLSNIRLGIILSIIKGLSLQDINKLFFLIRRNHVLSYSGSAESTQLEADRSRAQLIRQYFSPEKVNA